jgi:hypothetical protein
VEVIACPLLYLVLLVTACDKDLLICRIGSKNTRYVRSAYGDLVTVDSSTLRGWDEADPQIQSLVIVDESHIASRNRLRLSSDGWVRGCGLHKRILLAKAPLAQLLRGGTPQIRGSHFQCLFERVQVLWRLGA